jgi:hypothetical protein
MMRRAPLPPPSRSHGLPGLLSLFGAAATPDPLLTPPRGEGHPSNVCMTAPVQATLACRWVWVCARRTAWHRGASEA